MNHDAMSLQCLYVMSLVSLYILASVARGVHREKPRSADKWQTSFA